MPLLEKIIISDFRNIAFSELQFSGRLNCVCGDNGQGKTNLLDAVYYLSMTKSAFAPTDRYCVRHGCDSFSLSGVYRMEDGLRSRFIITSSSDGTKTLRRDDRQIARLSSHIGTIPVVMVSPQDYSLVDEGGDQRRRFVNSVLSQLDPEYLAGIQRYNRALVQRNRILKEPSVDASLLDILDLQMDATAYHIAAKRRKFAAEILGRIADYYRRLSGGAEEVGVEYRSDLFPDSAGEPVSLADILGKSRDKDMILKYTTRGVQRDDFIFTMGGYPIRKCGSQGQQKSFLVALKLAQYDIMKTSCGFAPTLLLDDVFDKLDFSRTGNLLKIVSDSGYGQIFITDTNRERLEGVVSTLASDVAYFNARGGEF